MPKTSATQICYGSATFLSSAGRRSRLPFEDVLKHKCSLVQINFFAANFSKRHIR